MADYIYYRNPGQTTTTVRPLYRGVQVVWYVFDVVGVLLMLRFILRLMAANPGAGFTSFIYSVTYPLVAPFQAVFSSTRVAGSAFEWTTLLAILVYYLLALALVRLFSMGRPVSNIEAQETLREQDVV